MTLKAGGASITACLQQHKRLAQVSDSSRLDVELLLQHVLNKKRSYLYAWPEKELNEAQAKQFNVLLERRIKGEPVAYIIGAQGFWTLDLQVNSSTLIPRPETELLVELALTHCTEESRVLDLGTGTGAIALALASEILGMHVEGVDYSEQAITLAQSNAKLNGISDVKFFQGDWCANVRGHFDVIVSNPPYIEESDEHLSQGDVRFEPKSALVSGKDGLDDIRIICKQAKSHLFENGVLMLEHGWHQAEEVCKIFAKNGYENIQTAKDLGGRDRVTFGFFN